MATPFDDFEFSASGDATEKSAPGILNDDVVRVLNGMNPRGLASIAFTPVSAAPKQVQGGTAAGIDRVNNSDREMYQKDGVIAYKDKNGRAVLTNMDGPKEDVPDRKIPAVFKPIPPSNEVQKPDTPLPIFEQLNKLRVAGDVETARGIWTSLQESLVAEQSRLETEAFKFAENKLGLPNLMRELEMARQADRADPLYVPGMGDSPITRKIVDDMTQLRVLADREAKGFLTNNASYRSALTAIKTGEDLIKRAEQKAEREENLRLQKELTLHNADVNRRLTSIQREEDRAAKADQIAVEQFEGLSANQLARLNILHVNDLANYKDITDDTRKKVKVMSLILRESKNKQFQEVMNAENDQQLLSYALQGNEKAKTVAVANEAARRGITAKEVEEEITALQRKLTDPKLAMEVLGKRMKPEEAKLQVGQMQAAMHSLDPNKKLEINQQRVTLLMEWAADQRTNQFLNDVRSWRMTDPGFQSAIDRSVKTTGGKADIQNVMAAYLEDATGTERLARLEEFRKQIKNAAAKYDGSIFGMPDYRKAEALVVSEIANKGIFAEMIRAVRGADKSMKSALGIDTNTSLAENTALFGLLPKTAGAIDALFPVQKDKK